MSRGDDLPDERATNLVLDPGSYVLSAKLYVVTDPNEEAVVTCMPW